MKTAILIALSSLCAAFAVAMLFLTVDGIASLDPFAVATGLWSFIGFRAMVYLQDITDDVNTVNELDLD